jgi:hypothetical protein
VQAILQKVNVGTATIDIGFLEMMEMLAKSGIELSDKPADKVAILEELLEIAKDYEKNTKAKYDVATAGTIEYAQAKYFRCDTEIKLIRAKREAAKEKKK